MLSAEMSNLTSSQSSKSLGEKTIYGGKSYSSSKIHSIPPQIKRIIGNTDDNAPSSTHGVSQDTDMNMANLDCPGAYSDSKVWRLDDMTKHGVKESSSPSGNPSNQQKQRRQIQIRGHRPSPLRINKDSHMIKKPPKLTHPEPVVDYNVSPKVVHTTITDFRSVVHQLTGVNNSVSDLNNSVSVPLNSYVEKGSLQDTELSTSAIREYDVVIRYKRGCISNDDFISHLRAALCRRGVSVREDTDEVDTVPECRVLIIFLTTTYVPSNLVNIVEKQSKKPRVVYPILYGISPFDLITNSKCYERFFLQDEPNRWQAALEEISQMHGYILTDKYVITRL